MIYKGMETSEALLRVEKTILKVSSQCPNTLRRGAHKIEHLTAAIVACEWAREPFSSLASHQPTYQQLYGELESALQLYKESKLETFWKRATTTEALTVEGIASISYTGQPRLRRGSHRSKGPKSRSLLEIQGCFNCESPGRIARDFPRPCNSAPDAAPKLDYLNKKKPLTQSTSS